MKRFLGLLLFFMGVFLLSACNDIEDPLQEEKDSVTITFETNNNIRLHPLTYERGESIDLPHLQTVGSVLFIGWFLDEDLTLEASNLENRAEDFTLYAKWETVPFEILIDVYTEVRVKHLFMNDLAMFMIDDFGDLYIQANDENPLAVETEWFEANAQQGSFAPSVDDGVTSSFAWTQNAFVVQSNGNVFAWGDNTYGQLGTGDKVSSGVFIDITNQFNLEPTETITKMVGNDKTTFALTSHGNLYAWGANEYDMIGEKDTIERLTPTNVKDFWCGQTDHFLVDSGLCGDTDHLIVDIVVTDGNVLILTNWHQLFVWGDDIQHWFDEVEITSANITEAVYMYLEGHITHMVAGPNFGVTILCETGIILILGASSGGGTDHGWAGGPVRMSIPDYLDVDDDGDSLPTVYEVYVANDTILILLSDGTLLGLGDNSTNLISHKKGYDHYRALSEVVLNFKPITLAVSSQEACALDDGGSLWCWGTSSSKNLSHKNEMILSTNYYGVTYKGSISEDSAVWEKDNDGFVPQERGDFPIKWMAPESIVAPPFSQSHRIYTVTRYHVTAIPPSIMGLEITSPVIDADGNGHPDFLELVFSELEIMTCNIDTHDCDDTDISVHPDTYRNRNTSNKVVRWTLEVRVARFELA